MTLDNALYGLFILFCGGLALMMFGRHLLLKSDASTLSASTLARLAVIYRRAIVPLLGAIVVDGVGTMTRGDHLQTLLEVSSGLFLLGAVCGILYFVLFSLELRKAPLSSAPQPSTDAAKTP